MNKEFEILKKDIVYQGFFRVEKYRLKHTLFKGGWSPEISRELFARGECVGVLLYDPDADKVVLIEQFRVGALTNETNPWLIEIVAGAIETGETAEAVAFREAEEETGCQIQAIFKIGQFYTTPGGCGERLTLFCGKVDSTAVGGVFGLEEENEDILVRAVDFSEAYSLLEKGLIASAIPIIAIQWLALNRDHLRKKWLYFSHSQN